MWCRDPLDRDTHPLGIPLAVGRLNWGTSMVHTAAQYVQIFKVYSLSISIVNMYMTSQLNVCYVLYVFLFHIQIQMYQMSCGLYMLYIYIWFSFLSLIR